MQLIYIFSALHFDPSIPRNIINVHEWLRLIDLDGIKVVKNLKKSMPLLEEEHQAHDELKQKAETPCGYEFAKSFNFLIVNDSQFVKTQFHC